MLIKGMRAKFSQVGFCNEFLKSTGTKIIVEANPHDGVYGIVCQLLTRMSGTPVAGPKTFWEKPLWR